MSRITKHRWEQLRAEFENLYRGQGCTVKQVRDHFASRGYQVTERMVKRQIFEWQLHKTCRLDAMQTVLWLLGPDPATWPSANPRFSIRGKVISFHDVLKFFHRRGIRDPVRHVAQTLGADFRPVDAVFIQPQDYVDGYRLASDVPPPQFDICENRPRQLSLLNLRTTQLEPVRETLAYCYRYIASSQSANDKEPQVHQFTVHGRFGDRMQHGLYQLSSAKTQAQRDEAFMSFSSGFSLLAQLFADNHPMGLALYLTVGCEFMAKGATDLVRELLKHSTGLAQVLPSANHGYYNILRSILCSPDWNEALILTARAALSAMDTQDQLDWKTLYVKERLCDCLYHERMYNESAALRALLLEEQEQFYGMSARNVLWTLTNVADNHLRDHEFEMARQQYTIALERSRALQGFGQAKIRFAALEGLAKTRELQIAHAGVLWSGDVLEVLSYLDEAHALALTWFGDSNRRFWRIREQKRLIEDLLPSCDYIAPT